LPEGHNALGRDADQLSTKNKSNKKFMTSRVIQFAATFAALVVSAQLAAAQPSSSQSAVSSSTNELHASKLIGADGISSSRQK
jgi:hypothetical protein